MTIILFVRLLVFCLGSSGLNNVQQIDLETGTAPSAVPVLSSFALPQADSLPVNKRVKLASFRRTPCFGSCPAYSVEVWSDGQVTWNGEQHVTRLGAYTAQAPAGWIKDLLRKGELTGFFKLGSYYPTNGRPVPDVPQTIIMLRQGMQEHQVTDSADAPLELQQFERYWQEKLEMLSWKVVRK